MATSTPHALGWLPEDEKVQLDKAQRVGRIVRLPRSFRDDRPLPASFSLSRFRQWWHDQGPVGTCFANAGVQLMQVHTAADVASGARWEQVPLSRAFTAKRAAARDGSRNPANGGTIVNTLTSLDVDGSCREVTWPYKPQAAYLSKEPPEAATAEAKLNNLDQVVQPEMGDEVRRLIFNGHPSEIGIWWPYSWDTQGGTWIKSIGSGTYGHALVLIGWHTDPQGVLWWQIENSHGLIYSPVEADLAATIPGYKPATSERTSDFWVPDANLRTVMKKAYTEIYSAAGMTGFRSRSLDWEDML